MSVRRSFLFIFVRKIETMKNILTVIILLSIVACKKSSESVTSKADSVKIIDSINAARTKINDSILSHNRFRDWDGTHILTHDMIAGKGKISFTKTGRDEYQIKGEIRNGKNYLTIEGTGDMLSERHLSFEGTIRQSIRENDNGKTDIRKGRLTFLTKDGGKPFRLQQSVNSSGFSDEIYIKF